MHLKLFVMLGVRLKEKRTRLDVLAVWIKIRLHLTAQLASKSLLSGLSALQGPSTTPQDTIPKQLTHNLIVCVCKKTHLFTVVLDDKIKTLDNKNVLVNRS